MRLDHLLSKERLRDPSRGSRCYLMDMLATRHWMPCLRLQRITTFRCGDELDCEQGQRNRTRCLVVKEPEAFAPGWSSFGTPSFAQTPQQLRCLTVCRLFENCIASTKVKSILYNPSYKGLMVDALASGAEEGRGRLRKVSMSCQASIESGMSELGNQAGVMPSHSGLNI